MNNNTLIIPCAGQSYLGRLTLAATKVLVAAHKGTSLPQDKLEDLSLLNSEVEKAENCILVEGCDKGCLQNKLTDVERKAEFHLILTDLGLEEREDEKIPLPEDIELATDGIVASATKVEGIFPRMAGGCCC